MMLGFIFLMLFCNALCWSDMKKHVITVNGANGSDSESCLQGEVPCATFNMALKGLNYSNSTVIYISPGNYTLEYGEINNITGMDQIAIIGSATVINCDPAAGLYILHCTNVTIQSITFIGCGYENDLSQGSLHFLSAAICFSSCQDVSVTNVTVRYSNGSGLLFIDTSRYLTVHNSVISSGYLWSLFSNDIAVGGIVFASIYYEHTENQHYVISSSSIVNNNYTWNVSAECVVQAVAAVTMVGSSADKVCFDSCLIANNSRGFYLDSRFFILNSGLDLDSTVISNNYYASVMVVGNGMPEIGMRDDELLNDGLLIKLNPEYYPDGQYCSSSYIYLNISTLFMFYIRMQNSSFSKYQIACVDDKLPDFCFGPLAPYYTYTELQDYDDPPTIEHCPISYLVCSVKLDDNCTCYDNHDGTLCGQCKEGYSVAINSPYLSCVPCDSLTVLKGWGLLIILEFVPVAIMVALIAILNVNLNQGSLKAYVFFCQIFTIPFPAIGYPSWLFSSYKFSSRIRDLALLPFSIWNLGFISFPSCNLFQDGNECSSLSICISRNTTPLGAITFWYIIGFYPFLLLALIYGFFTMYDKGYKCVVCFGRPLHRFLARFWRMFNIQPSFTHTVASVYTLCFTQLAATSLKILHATTYTIDDDGNSTLVFMYDGSQQYFHGYHGAAATLALLVLMIFIVIPTVYLLAYPFNWFPICFNKIKFKKDFLISVTDVFTGPYKDSTQLGFWDYRYFAGIYFGIQLLLMMLMQSYSFIGGFPVFPRSLAIGVCGLHIIVLTTLRPYKRNMHTLTETIFFLMLLGFITSIVLYFVVKTAGVCFTHDVKDVETVCIAIMYFFSILVSFYCFIWILKKCKYVFQYLLALHTTASIQVESAMPIVQDQDDDEDDVFADRLMNPQKYDERHIAAQ